MRWLLTPENLTSTNVVFQKSFQATVCYSIWELIFWAVSSLFFVSTVHQYLGTNFVEGRDMSKFFGPSGSLDPPMEGFEPVFFASIVGSSKWRQAFEGSGSLGQVNTLPKTNKSSPKIGHPKRKFIFQSSIFRCELLVSWGVSLKSSIISPSGNHQFSGMGCENQSRQVAQLQAALVPSWLSRDSASCDGVTFPVVATECRLEKPERWGKRRRSEVRSTNQDVQKGGE